MSDSFLDLYLRYTAHQESPESFHMMTAITCVGAAMGRKCYMDRGYYKLFPNFFTILVAGSARCRKSTAIKIGTDLLKAVPTTKVISGKTTPERFIKEIEPLGATTPLNILVHSSELSVFLTKQQYGEPMIHMLTDLFDCPSEWPYLTKNKGDNFLRNVFLCIIAATTPDGVSKGIPASALEEGFASRVLFIYRADTDRRNAIPELTDEEKDLRNELVAHLSKIGELEGEYTLERHAKAWFVEWYNTLGPHADKRLEGFQGRKHDHLLRLGMVFAGSCLEKLVDQGHLEAALLLLEDIEHHAPLAFSEIGADDKTQFLSRAARHVEKSVRISHSELLRKCYPCRADTFKNLVETLIESGFMKRDESHPSIYVWLGVPI
jgi:Protein of unknown function (DUF3987)